jgi:transmembrane sensor
MTLQRQIDQLITHRASEWLEILKTGGPREREAFVDWLHESRKHVSEFLTMVALDRELSENVFKDLLDREALLERVSPRVSGLRNAAASGSQPIQTTVRKPIRWYRAAALAAGLAGIAIALILMLRTFSPTEDFATANGEQRPIELADGSVVLLNSASRVHVDFNGSGRDLELLSGEALFKVAKDARRPFRVRTRDALVQAVGTQFNVNTRKAGTVVSVLEGKVWVSSKNDQGQRVGHIKEQAALSAGEEASVVSQGRIDRHIRPNVASVANWRQRRLRFQRTAIEGIVREFNQHNATPKLRLEGIEAGSRHYSAIFDADDPGSFADFLRREQDLAIDKRGNELVIRRR